jgi:hypothetical protein
MGTMKKQNPAPDYSQFVKNTLAMIKKANKGKTGDLFLVIEPEDWKLIMKVAKKTRGFVLANKASKNGKVPPLKQPPASLPL